LLTVDWQPLGYKSWLHATLLKGPVLC